MKNCCKFCCVPVFFLWQTVYLSAQICGIWPGGEIPRETRQSLAGNTQENLLTFLPAIGFFQEKVKVNGNELHLSLSLVPDQTLQKAKDLLGEKFPRSSRYYTGSTLQAAMDRDNNGGVQELSLIQLNGIRELVLFTLDQPAAASLSAFRVPEDFKKQYWIPENGQDFVFVEYPMRNAKLLSFHVPAKDSENMFRKIHEHLLAHRWQPGKQEKLMTDAIPQKKTREEKKEKDTVTEKNPLSPVYYQEQEQKLLLLFYRIENNVCRFSYYERPLQN